MGDVWNTAATIGWGVASLVFGVVGYFIIREIRQNDDFKKEMKAENKALQSQIIALTIRLTTVTTVLEDRHLMPRPKLKFPSPPPAHIEDSAG